MEITFSVFTTDIVTKKQWIIYGNIALFSDFPLMEIDMEETEQAVAELKAILDRANNTVNKMNTDYGMSKPLWQQNKNIDWGRFRSHLRHYNTDKKYIDKKTKKWDVTLFTDAEETERMLEDIEAIIQSDETTIDIPNTYYGKLK